MYCSELFLQHLDVFYKELHSAYRLQWKDAFSPAQLEDVEIEMGTLDFILFLACNQTCWISYTSLCVRSVKVVRF